MGGGEKGILGTMGYLEGTLSRLGSLMEADRAGRDVGCWECGLQQHGFLVGRA